MYIHPFKNFIFLLKYLYYLICNDIGIMILKNIIVEISILSPFNGNDKTKTLNTVLRVTLMILG